MLFYQLYHLSLPALNVENLVVCETWQLQAETIIELERSMAIGGEGIEIEKNMDTYSILEIQLQNRRRARSCKIDFILIRTY